jgi:hypothetical protein
MQICITYCNPNAKLAKDIGTEEKLDITSQPEKGEHIFYKCSNVLFTHISV